MYRVILFDFDGTIADTFDNFMIIVGKLLDKYNLPVLSREELEKLRSESASSIIKRLGIPIYKVPFMARDMKKLQQENIATMKSFEGIPQILHKIKERGYILGIVTSNAKENVMQFLENNNIAIFDYIHTDSSIFGKDKVIAKLLTQQSLPEKDVLYIGDEIRDIEACRNVGVTIVSVTWGFTTKEGLQKYNPDFIIDKPEELLSIVLQ